MFFPRCGYHTDHLEAEATVEPLGSIDAHDTEAHGEAPSLGSFAKRRHQMGANANPLRLWREVEPDELERPRLLSNPLTPNGLARDLDDLVRCWIGGLVEASPLIVLVPRTPRPLDVRAHRLPVHTPEELHVGCGCPAQADLGCFHSCHLAFGR